MTATLIDRSTCTATSHGTEWAYNRYKCRCPDSREAARIAKKRGRDRNRGYTITPPVLVDSAIPAGHLRELHSQGMTYAGIARTLGYRVNWVLETSRQHTARIAEDRAAAIADLHARLYMPDPLPVFDEDDPDIDEVAVYRIVHADELALTAAERSIRLTKAERAEIARRMAVLPGMSATQIVKTTGVKFDTARELIEKHGTGTSRELSDLIHGTVTAYQYGCRCLVCREANRDKTRNWKYQNAGKTPPTHGSSGYSNYGCRCDVCSDAHGQKMKERHDRLKSRADQFVTRERAAWTPEELTVVAMDGLSVSEVAKRLGRSYRSVKSRRFILRQQDRTTTA